jgi:uncharacterized lipoprotein YddW (UPF0748 family)
MNAVSACGVAILALACVAPAAADEMKPSVSAVRGVWVDHVTMLSSDASEKLVLAAKQAKLNTVYPAAARYACAHYKSAVLPPCDSGATEDAFARFRAQAQAQGLTVIPWVERILQVPPKSRPGLVEPIPLNADGFDVLDVDNPMVREMLLGALVEMASAPGVPGVHVDDNMEYDRALAGDQADAYEAKLTSFVNWLARSFKVRAPGKFFEVSHHPLPFAERRYLAAWDEWTEVDRFVVQCYRSSAAAVLADAGCRADAGRRIVGLGVAGTANHVALKDEEILAVFKEQARRGDAAVLFYAGDLLGRPALPALLGSIP